MGKNSRGYTLVELIVVMAIIGVLVTLGLVNYATSQKKARDGRRKADLEEIRSALEMYRVDDGSYPCPNQSTHINGGDCLSTTLVGGGYFSTMPLDPKEAGATGGGPCGGGRYGYMYRTNGTIYRVWTHLEYTTGYSSNCDNPFGACLPTADCYMVTNP